MHRHRLFAVFILFALYSCLNEACTNPLSSDRMPVTSSCSPTTSPLPLPSANVSTDNLTGDWFSSNHDWPSGPIGSCQANVAYNLRMTQSGTKLTGTVSLVGYPQGGGLYVFPETLSGTDNNGLIKLSGEERHADGKTVATTYQLRYNKQTQHLSGTRNGQPFWLIPIVAQSCPLPRPECGEPIS